MPSTYQKNFLSDVIFRIDFSPILELESDTPKEFQKIISEKFPILEPLKQMQLFVENNGKETTAKNTEKTVWRFKTSDGSAFVELDSNFFAVVFKKYNNFTEFKEKIEFCINTLFQIYPNIAINRQGLRYINQIHFDEQDFFDWSNYINESLINNLDFIEDKNLLRRYFNTFDLILEEGIQLNFKYGIFNKTYPEAITGKEFVLDYDCFSQSVIKQDELISVLEKLNNYATIYFEKSITDSLKDKLNE